MLTIHTKKCEVSKDKFNENSEKLSNNKIHERKLFDK